MEISILALPYYAWNSYEYKHIKYRIKVAKLGIQFINEQSKKWKKANPEKAKESWRKYNLSHKKEHQDYYIKNKEIISQRKYTYYRKRYIENREEFLLKAKLRYKNKKEIILKYNRNWRELNKFDVIFHYSCGEMCCINCRENIYELLTVDHIYGGGNKHRKRLVSGSNFYLWLRRHNFPEGFQILCYNCNAIKQRVTPERYNEIINELRSRKLSMDFKSVI